MSLSTAQRILDFVFDSAQGAQEIDIGFFGGEPLLKFDLVRRITAMIQTHKSYDPNRVVISITSNGTIFSKKIAEFLREKKIVLCISCDGPPSVHDVFRHFPDGSGSSAIVERNIKSALKVFPLIPVNAVYSPENVHFLPDVVDYLSSLGVRNIYLNPNISAKWTRKEADMLPRIYGIIGEKYQEFYRRGEPRYISLIDGKIVVILRGGYTPFEKCRMGNGEFAFAASGNAYNCERLVGSDDGVKHCLGNINEGFKIKQACEATSGIAANKECVMCTLKDYCMNWCGCTNYCSTGRYDFVSPFICASERAAINVAFDIIKNSNDTLLRFFHHISGTPLMNVAGDIFRQ